MEEVSLYIAYLKCASLAVAAESVPFPGVTLTDVLDLRTGTAGRKVAQRDLLVFLDGANCNQILNT